MQCFLENPSLLTCPDIVNVIIMVLLQDIEEAIVTLIHGAVWDEALRLVSTSCKETILFSIGD